MNAPTDTELVSRIASEDLRALGQLFDRHARSIYGYALLVTRRAADARAVVVRTFAALALSPERLATTPDARRSLLAAARPIAWAAAQKHAGMIWFLSPRSRALDRSAPAELRISIDSSPGEVAEEMGLLATEGFNVHDLATARAGTAAPPTAAWRRCPGGLRPLVVMHARDALRPWRRWLRRALVAATIPASLLFAHWTTTLRPTLPEVPEVATAAPRAVVHDPDRRRDTLDILGGFRDQAEKR